MSDKGTHFLMNLLFFEKSFFLLMSSFFSVYLHTKAQKNTDLRMTCLII
jgi:hypothetical protein